MAELLSKWINQDVGLSIPVQSFERDFSNGYYLGELLCKLSLLDAATFSHFACSSHPHALTANWGFLGAALRNQGIKCDATQAQEIMHAKAGAALKLMYQIKMAVQRREQSQAQQALFAGSAAASPSKSKTTASLPSIAGAERTTGSALGFTSTLGGPGATAAFTSPKGHQPARPFDRLEQRRLAENLLHLSHANKKEKHMDIHLAPFAKAAAAAEEKVRDEALREEEARSAALRASQLAAREKLQSNMAYTRSWNSGGMHIWRENMDRIDATKAARKQWQSSQATKANQESYLRGREKQHEVATGIDSFEKNLERIGGAKSAAASSSSAQSEAEEGGYANYAGPQGEASAVQAMSVKLAASLGSPAQLAKQSAEHMARIHDKVASDALARKERDRRRRRVLVEQGAQSSALEDANRQELFLEKLSKECAEERAIAEEVWRTNQLYEVIKSNTAYREAQEAKVREEQQRRIVAQQASHYASIKADHERSLAAELSRFQEVRLEVAAQKHQENTLYAQQLVGRIVDVAHKAVCFREVSEQALIPPPMWREWMSLFVQGLPLLPGAEGDSEEERGSGLESLHPAAASPHATASAASQGMDLESSLPPSLLSAMVPARPRTTMGAATPKTPSGSKSKDASAAAAKPGSAAAIAAAAAAQAEFDSQSLTTDAFYASLHLNREVSRLMSSLRDVNPSTAEIVDAEALEDYLAARNEWSYDIKEVAPPELVNAQQQNQSGALVAPAATSLSPTPRSRSRPGSSTGSSVSNSKKALLGSSPEPAEDGGKKSPAAGSKKAKEMAAAAAAAAAAEAAASGTQPFTSLSFLPPLHPADTFDLSEPLPPADAPSALVAASATPASHNPLFGALLQRILDVASGKESPSDLPDLPRFPLALALLGKPYSGRSTQAAALSEKYGLAVLRAEQIVEQAAAELEQLEAAPLGAGGEKLSARAEKKAAAAAAAAAASGSSDSSAASRKSAAGSKAVKSPYHQLLIRMKKLLAKSEPLSDDILVGLIVEAIRRLPARVASAKAEAAQERARRIEEATDAATGEILDESVRAMVLAGGENDPSLPLLPGEGGFVLLGFPSTAAQARLLEQALSGFEPPKPATSKSTGAPRLGKTKAGGGGKDAKLSSKIARAPTPPPPTGVAPSAFHLVLRLEAENDVLLRRALGRRIDPLTNRPFHLDYAQPTEADMHPAASAAAGASISKAEALTLKSRLQPLASEVDFHARLPELFLNYEAEQPSLTEWFAQFGTLHSIPCSAADQPLSIEAVRESIREIVRGKMEELDAKAVEDERVRAEAERAAAIAAGEIVPPPLHPLEAALVDAPNRAAAEAYAAQQAAAAAEEAAQPASPAPTGSRKLGGDGKKDAAAAKDKDRAAASADGAESDQFVPPVSYPIFTGAELYSFASSGFFDLSLSSFLLSKWELCESNFLRQSKQAFRALRAIRAQNLEYFAATRRNFFAFLRRPDSKTLALQSFQTAFNSLPQDLRADPSTKDELHMRLDELGEALWRINAAKHEENEAEFSRIVCGGNSLGSGAPPNAFLESQSAAFFFYYALLAQIELDRYLQTIKIAQDFFAALKGHVVHEERFERDEKMEKKRAAAAAAAAAGSSAAGAEGETARTASSSALSAALGEPRGGLGLKLHINLPLRISLGDPKVRAARKKEAEALKKKQDAAANASSSAASGAASAAPSASSSAASLAKDGGSSGGSKKSKSGALPSARKRFSASGSTVMSFDASAGEDDPFAELLDTLRANFISPDEALEQISANTDLDSLMASVAGAGGTSRGGAKGSKKPAAAAGAGAGANKAPGTPSTAAAGSGTRGASAGKKRGAKGAVVPASSGPPRPASREALLDAQFRALVTRENQILSARIRRIHRNAHLELSQLKYYNEKLFLPKLDAYLELRIRGESAAIDSLMFYVRTRIEEERCLTHSIRLEGENAFIDQDVLAVPAPESSIPSFVSGFSDLFDPLYSTRLSYAQLIHVANTMRSISVGGSAGLDVKAAEVYALLLSQFHATHTSGAAGAASSFYPIAGEQNLPVKWSPAAIAAASDSSSNAFVSHASSVASLPAAQAAIGAGSSAITRGLLATGSVQAYFRSLVGMFAGGVDATAAPLASGQPAFKHAYIDFRDLLVSCTLLDSIATPSINQLRSMQALYAAADADADGSLTWDEFSSVALWFESAPSDSEEGQMSLAQKQSRMESDRRTVEPIKRVKEFFFHLFASEVERPSDSLSGGSGGGPVSRAFLLPSLDFLLYLCFDDDASSESSSGAAKSGQEKAALLVGQAQAQAAQWSAITQAFVQRYVAPPQPNTHGSKQRHTSTSMASTTAAEKFTRKDLTKAAQAQASA